MEIQQFIESIDGEQPPGKLTVYQLALWYDAKGDWTKAHETIQDVTTENASWIHAYLHRKEGDKFNAAYWYTKAHKKMPTISLQQEWEQIAKTLLAV